MDFLAAEEHLVDLGRIATSKEELLKFRSGPIDYGSLSEAKNRRFDHAPVVDDAGRLLGVIPVSHVDELHCAGHLIEPNDPELYLHKLPDRMPLLPFLEEIAEHRAVVIWDTDGQHGPDWFAMVAISDLNRHRFRSYLYPIVAELEAALAQLVDTSFPDPAEWIRTCSEERQVYHFGQWRVADEKGVDTSPIISCTLMDLVNVVAKTQRLWEALGYRGRKHFEKATSPLRDLRNQIMHPVRPLILSQKDVTDLEERLSTVLDVMERVNRLNEVHSEAVLPIMRHMP